jgi:cell division protease FtsH
VPLSDDVDLELQARGTPGFVGADLQNLVNEAALLAARRNGQRVERSDFENAKDKVLMGAERRSMIMTDEDRRITAFHEAGHALVALMTPEHSDPVHKVTIIPRGLSLGLTQTLPVEDRLNYTENDIFAIIRYAMGGRAAEELIFGHLSTGASNDLQQATNWARRMVTEFGMNSNLGPVSYADSSGDVFIGRDMMTRKDYSEGMAKKIDEEITVTLRAMYLEAREILSTHRDKLEAIAEALLERETLETSDLDLLVSGQALPPMAVPSAGDSGGSGTRDPEAGIEEEDLPEPEPLPS